jgi:nucleoid-associated protein YgaU
LADSPTTSTPAASAQVTAVDTLAPAAGPGPVPAATSAPAPGGAQTYVVQAGDTLGKIAKDRLGSAGPKAVKKILDANPGLDPARLKVGATIKLP